MMPPRRRIPDFLNVPWRVRDVIAVVLIWFGLQLLLGVGLVVVGQYVPAAAQFLASADKGDIGLSFALNLAGILMGFGLVAVYLQRYKVGWKAVGWRRFSWGKAGLYLLGIFVVFLVLANVALLLVKTLVPGFDADQAQVNEFTQNAGTHRNLALIALVLLPPIFEETIFRGFIFPAIAKRMGVVWGALISSMIFGVAHGQPNLFVYTTILGLLLCFMYRRLGSIIPGIALHMLNNYLAFLAITGK